MAYLRTIFKTFPEEEQPKLTAAFQHWLRQYEAGLNVHLGGPLSSFRRHGFEIEKIVDAGNVFA
jgi:hypothetical protein